MTAQALTRWTPTLVLEDALELFTDDELCTRHNVSLGELTAFRTLQVYRRSVAEARKEIAEQGLTFKAKARLQAEKFLDEEVPRWMGDADTPVKDKLTVLSKLVEWSDLGPKQQAQQAGGGFTFVVNLGGDAPPQTIEVINAQPVSEGAAGCAQSVPAAAPVAGQPAAVDIPPVTLPILVDSHVPPPVDNPVDKPAPAVDNSDLG